MLDLKLNIENADLECLQKECNECLIEYMEINNSLNIEETKLLELDSHYENMATIKDVIDLYGWNESIEYLIGDQLKKDDVNITLENFRTVLHRTAINVAKIATKFLIKTSSALQTYYLKFKGIDLKKVDESMSRDMAALIKKTLSETEESTDSDSAGVNVISVLSGLRELKEPTLYEKLKEPWSIEAGVRAYLRIASNEILPNTIKQNDVFQGVDDKTNVVKLIKNICNEVDLGGVYKKDYNDFSPRRLKEEVSKAVKYLPMAIKAVNSSRKLSIDLKREQQDKEQIVQKYRENRDNKSFGTIQNAAEMQKKAAIANRQRKQIKHERIVECLKRFCLHKTIMACKRLDRVLTVLNLKPVSTNSK